MGTYTDARLLDTSEAIEALPMFRNQPAQSATPRKLAPTTGQSGQNQSIPVNLVTGDLADQDTKKTSKSLGNTRFIAVGGTELESVTSTMSTSKVMDENTVNHGVKCDAAERLHQCLHQISQLIESYGPETLADALAELLGVDRCERLADAIGRRGAKR